MQVNVLLNLNCNTGMLMCCKLKQIYGYISLDPFSYVSVMLIVE